MLRVHQDTCVVLIIVLLKIVSQIPLIHMYHFLQNVTSHQTNQAKITVSESPLASCGTCLSYINEWFYGWSNIWISLDLTADSSIIIQCMYQMVNVHLDMIFSGTSCNLDWRKEGCVLIQTNTYLTITQLYSYPRVKTIC